jgi:hypothetical protein
MTTVGELGNCEMRIAKCGLRNWRSGNCECGLRMRNCRSPNPHFLLVSNFFSRSAIPHSAIRSPHFHDTPALVGRSRANARSLRAPNAEADSCEQESQDKRDSNQEEGFLQTD